VGADRRIGPAFLFPGVGYGGSCFPKDVKALSRFAADKKYDFKILKAVEAVNERQKKVLLTMILEHFRTKTGRRRTAAAKPLSGLTIAMWGLSFKPRTDDMREAPSVVLINGLLRAGAEVRAHDPVAMGEAYKIFRDRIFLAGDDYEALKGKSFLLTWASGALARSWCSVQEALLVASRFGMNVTVARPDGYDLDPQVYEWTRANCAVNGTTFNITNDNDAAYDGVHVVYSRNWVTPAAYQDGAFQKKAEQDKARAIPGWITTAARMARGDNPIFTHPMPIDRGMEVEDPVASGPRSAIYDIAENRLHVQKAVLALTMGNL
jgi:hypothetical protein